MPSYSLSLSCTVAPTKFSVARTSFSPRKLVPGRILFPLIDSSLFSVLSLVLSSLLGVVGPLPPPVVQDPGLIPLGDFLPRSAPSLQRSGRSPRACPYSWPSVLGTVPALDPVLETVSAPVRRNPRHLVRGILPTPSSIPSASRR